MTTKFMNIGGDLALIFDRHPLDSRGIDGETSLDVTMDETGIHLRPIIGDRSARVLASGFKMMKIHDVTFRKLAL